MGLWEGVSLAHILDQSGAARDAVVVLLEGADSGRLLQDSPEMPYCQIVPAEKCLCPESLLAFKLNDRFLPRRNSFSARALFPGWYGMDSVDWLQPSRARDVVPNFHLSSMNKVYNRVVKTPAGELKITRLTEIQVRSVIAWPADNARLPPSRYVIRGFACTATGLIRFSNFSADGGRASVPAQLESPPRLFTWVCWKYLWSAAPGDYVLMSRAVDDAGREQPLPGDPARRDVYELNSCCTCAVLGAMKSKEIRCRATFNA